MFIIMIIYDLGVVVEMCDEVIVMYGGKIVEYIDVDMLFYVLKYLYMKVFFYLILCMEDDVEVLNMIKGIVFFFVNMLWIGCCFVN